MALSAWAGRFLQRDDLTFWLDDIGPLPAGAIGPLVNFIGTGDEALALWGYAQRLVTHDFGGDIGVRQVLVFEKAALIYFPDAAPPWQVQGLGLQWVAAVLRGP